MFVKLFSDNRRNLKILGSSILNFHGQNLFTFHMKIRDREKQSDDTIHEPFVSNMNLVSALKLN